MSSKVDSFPVALPTDRQTHKQTCNDFEHVSADKHNWSGVPEADIKGRDK